MRQLKCLTLSNIDKPCVCKKISESPTNFLVMYVCNIQHIEKVVSILYLVNDMLITNIFMKKTWVKHPIYLASIGIDISGC